MQHKNYTVITKDTTRHDNLPSKQGPSTSSVSQWTTMCLTTSKIVAGDATTATHAEKIHL